MECVNCSVPLNHHWEKHYGSPLFEGEVCTICNLNYVVPHRMNLLFKHLNNQKLKGEQLTLKLYEEEE